MVEFRLTTPRGLYNVLLVLLVAVEVVVGAVEVAIYLGLI